MNTHVVLMLDLGREMRGGQRQVLYLARYLARTQTPDGQQPTFVPVIACPANSALAQTARHEGLSVLPLTVRSALNPLLWIFLQKALTKMQVRILHTHDAHSAFVGAVIRSLGAPVTLVHSRRVSYMPTRGLRLWKYKQGDAVVGVSHEIANNMIAAGIPAARVHTIHSGIDPDSYTPRQPHSEATPFTFLAIGALTRQKGFSVLLNAAELLAKESDLPPWKVRIVGDGELMTSLQVQCRDLRLGVLAELPGRMESRTELPFCDALVVPSVDGEGSSATIKEAWATGVPLVASDLTSNCELVKDGENGLLAAAGDPRSLAEKMKAILTSSQLAAKLVCGGHASLPCFTDTTMAESYRKLYCTLLCSSNGR